MSKNPDFEQDYWSRTAQGVYKIAHDGIRLMKCTFIMIDHFTKVSITMI